LAFVEELQDADDETSFVADRQAEEFTSSKAETLVDVGLEARIVVGVVEADGLALAGDPSGDAARDGQADELLLEGKADGGPDFFALAVDEKNGAAVGAGLARSDLQNDVDEFAEVECGVQELGGFDDAGELFHGAAALGQSQNNSGETREVVELSAELVVQD